MKNIIKFKAKLKIKIYYFENNNLMKYKEHNLCNKIKLYLKLIILKIIYKKKFKINNYLLKNLVIAKLNNILFKF